MTDVRSATRATCLVRLSGELDLATADAIPAAAATALEQGAERLVLDLEAVTFMDSQGLRALVEAQRALGHAGVGFELTGVPPVVLDLLDHTGLRQVLGVD